MTEKRKTPIHIDKAEFRQMGHRLIDAIADFADAIEQRPVTTGESPRQIRALLQQTGLPTHGTSAAALLERTADMLFQHSLLNGHPRFMGYITSSAAPLGALADLLAASVNPNVGAYILSPVATEIEKQTVQWLAELIGVSPDYGGILVSGGNMANFTGFLAGRTAKAPGNIKEDGMAGAPARLLVYCSRTTHTWIEKAAVLSGLGTASIRWIPTDEANRMDNTLLEKTIRQDLGQGYQPLMVIGTAGDVSTGAVDNLQGIADICQTYNLWFHIDGAYGIPAASLPSLRHLFEGITQADSIALDPHKWLYSPLEAGCTLVRNSRHLPDTYSSHPEYYNFDSGKEEAGQNYYEYGLQNSRGFRALKVWLTLQQAGRSGYVEMIGQDIALSAFLFEKAGSHPELEAVTHNLSITTLRYVPLEMAGKTEAHPAYLNTLNKALLDALQQGGEVFLSNAIVREKYCLRSCIVNFRTDRKDIEDIVDIIVREGRKIHRQLQETGSPE